jgi:hypothetical protein
MLSANSLLAAAFDRHSVRPRRESCRRRIRSIKSVGGPSHLAAGAHRSKMVMSTAASRDQQQKSNIAAAHRQITHPNCHGRCSTR